MIVRDLITQLLQFDMDSEVVSHDGGQYSYNYHVEGSDSECSKVVVIRLGQVFDMSAHDHNQNEKDEDTTPTKCHICLKEYPLNQMRDMSDNFADMPVEVCIDCLANIAKNVVPKDEV